MAGNTVLSKDQDAELVRAPRTDDLRQLIQEGIDSGNAGPWDPEEIKAEARRRLAHKEA